MIEFVKNNLILRKSMKSITIAYSLCGEGFGHYGRSISIIKKLARSYPDINIDVYCYDYTFDMISRDKELPNNVKYFSIPGFRFVHNKTSGINFFYSMIANKKNWSVVWDIFMIYVKQYFFSFFYRMFSKGKEPSYEMTKKFFRPFDFAIADFEPLLPRVANFRKKKFITIDSLHIIQYGKFSSQGLSLRDWADLFVNKFFIKIIHPLSDLCMLTTIYPYEIRQKYKRQLVQVGPIVRQEIVDLQDKVSRDGYILIYVRKAVRKQILPVIKSFSDYKFVVFTEHLSEEEQMGYDEDFIEFHDVDPKKFLTYLAHCDAVLTTSGYTLISEAMILKKPFYAVIIGGVLGFEQKLSYYSLVKSGCGEGCDIKKFDHNHFKHFLDNQPEFLEAINKHHIHDDTPTVIEHIMNKIKDADLI